ERIKERKRPEADEGKLVAVERISNACWEKVIDQHIAGRSDPEPDDVVEVETMQGGVVNAGDGVRNDEVAEGPVDIHPDERGDEIPEAHVNSCLLPARHCDEE